MEEFGSWVINAIKCILLMYVFVGKRKRRREESSDPESDIDVCHCVTKYIHM